MISPIHDARLAQVQDELAELAEASRPEFKNYDAVRRLGSTLYLSYRGHRFLVPPVPAQRGFTLHELSVRIAEVMPNRKGEQTEAQRREHRALARQIVTWFARLVRPTKRWDWLRMRFGWNPFADASDAEIGELLLFFSACRMRSSVQVEGSTPMHPSGK